MQFGENRLKDLKVKAPMLYNIHTARSANKEQSSKVH